MAETEPRGGRGARDRILRAADTLFYDEGINATGMDRLTSAAHVSKRTFYQHFPSKNALVQEYLRRLDTQLVPHGEQALGRTDLSPRERLLGIFVEPGGDRRIRGCPFHNAAVETAGAVPAVARAVIAHKQAFTRILIATAAEAGAPDPDTLGRRLAILFEGATALATSLDDAGPVRDARALAAVLIESALGQ